MDKIVEDATQELIRKIRESDTYAEYLQQREKLMENPDLFEKADEFRKRNFEIQNDGQDGLFEKMDMLEQEYSEILENPLASDFLNAELAFCRMIQEINMMVAAEVDFL